jgi:hypothetical protein
MTTFLRSRLAPLLGVLLLWSALAPLAAAQQTRTLTIRDGTIYVDGQKLSASQVPSDLDLDGMTAQYQFVGIQRPVIELNGRLFAVRNGLKKVSEDEVNGQESSVILQEISARSSAARAKAGPDADPQRQYLNDVQKANRTLYERLVRERTMEQKAQNLAHVIRMMPEGSAERQARTDSLRTLLNNIFELKQENRRREIDRLEREIQELQRSLQKRRQMRERMIQYRLNELTGATAKQ